MDTESIIGVCFLFYIFLLISFMMMFEQDEELGLDIDTSPRGGYWAKPSYMQSWDEKDCHRLADNSAAEPCWGEVVESGRDYLPKCEGHRYLWYLKEENRIIRKVLAVIIFLGILAGLITLLIIEKSL